MAHTTLTQKMKPVISRRGMEIDASPIRSLLPYARQAKADGKNILHLNIGQPDIPTPPRALERVRNIDQKIIKYGHSEGLPELRQIVSKYYDKFNANISWEDIYVTTGASEAILFTLLACCDDRDEIIIPEPFYANYLGFAKISDVRIIPLTTYIKDEFALPSPDAFEQLITSNTKAIFLCNPGNPTGQLYSSDELKALLQIVKKHKLFLIVDEVYREFCYDEPFTSILSFEGFEDNVIVIDSISKVYSSCGARVGYLITKNQDILETVNKFAQLRLCPPYYGQELALGCYEDPDHYLARVKDEYRNRRQVMYDRLSVMKGVFCYKPKAAFYNLVALPVRDATHFCQWLLTDFELNGQTVMLAPANGFYFTQSHGKHQVRIAYILNEKDLTSAMDCLELALFQYTNE